MPGPDFMLLAPHPEQMHIALFWLVNTHHISEADANRLDELAGENSVHVQCASWGFWVSVPDYDDPDAMMEHLSTEGFSSAMSHIMSIARSHGVDTVQFDRNGMSYKFLKHFHW